MKKGSALHAFELMATAKAMAELFEANKEVTATYVHATSRGHEAIQLALATQLEPTDLLYPYYRDDAMLLGIGMKDALHTQVQTARAIVQEGDRKSVV